MSLWLLVWRLLRYRVAVMLLLFLLLSMALHANLTDYYKDLFLGAAALFFSYISATSINDLADQKIDALNHPNSLGRPLITGGAKNRDMRRVFTIASLSSLVLASLIGQRAAVIIAVSILINLAYSLPPIRLSYRTFLAPAALGLAYVGVPFLLGLTIVNNFQFTGVNVGWLAGLYLMFAGRIILKDFRDRVGDKKYHKPTFLLRFGKRATCIFSALGISAGGLVILWQVRHPYWLALVTVLYLSSILYMLYRLYGSKQGDEEQISIGIGAKMGNGLLINLLGVFSLRQSGASQAVQLAFSLGLSGLFFINYLAFLREPDKISLGYKG